MDRPASHDALETLAKLLALGVVLLPVAGAALRFIAFATGIPLTVPAYQLAWSAPVDQLAATGLAGLYPSVPVSYTHLTLPTICSV